MNKILSITILIITLINFTVYASIDSKKFPIISKITSTEILNDSYLNEVKKLISDDCKFQNYPIFNNPAVANRIKKYLKEEYLNVKNILDNFLPMNCELVCQNYGLFYCIENHIKEQIENQSEKNGYLFKITSEIDSLIDEISKKEKDFVDRYYYLQESFDHWKESLKVKTIITPAIKDDENAEIKTIKFSTAEKIKKYDEMTENINNLINNLKIGNEVATKNMKTIFNKYKTTIKNKKLKKINRGLDKKTDKSKIIKNENKNENEITKLELATSLIIKHILATIDKCNMELKEISNKLTKLSDDIKEKTPLEDQLKSLMDLF